MALTYLFQPCSFLCKVEPILEELLPTERSWELFWDKAEEDFIPDGDM